MAADTLYPPSQGPYDVIAAAGQACAEIVLPDGATDLETYAADELSGYLGRIASCGFRIRRESEPAERRFGVFLGNTRASSSAGIRTDEESTGRDGFAIRSTDNGIVIRGRTDLGTVFGVYELLERFFDVRWFMPGPLGEHVPARSRLEIGHIDLVRKPAFRVRWVGTGQWPLRQRMNAYVTAGGRSVGIPWKWHFHTFIELIPPERYFDEHPEYFALVRGQRRITDSRTHENQLCTSNPDVVREVAKNMIAVLDAEPEIEIITLSPNDGGGFCECEACRALDEPGRDWFARYARRLALFNNQVARIVGEAHPDVLIKVGAYAMYARPPLDADYRPEPNIFFQLCHLYFCHNHPLGQGGCRPGGTFEPSPEYQPNDTFCDLLDRWRALSPHLFLYEYYSIGGMARADLPWPVLHTIRHDIPYYRDHGVEGFYTQLDEKSWHRLGVNYYLAAKLCWNPDLDADAVLDDYFTKCYADAREPVQAYYMRMERAMQDWNGCASYGLQGVSGMRVLGPTVFRPDVMADLQEHLADAERLAEANETVRERVAMLRRMHVETEAALQTIQAG